MGIDDPAQDFFTGCPCSVAFQKFGDGDWFGAEGRVSGREWAKDGVNSVQEVPASFGQLSRRALSDTNKVVHEDIHCC
jgi:hypothetical protein